MALVVEDGTIVSGANSYVSDAELLAFTELRNYTLPTKNLEREAAVILAMDYVETFFDRFKGDRVSDTQALSWPRDNVVLYGSAFSETAIPNELKNAVCQLAYEITQGTVPQPTGSGKEVIREKVGTLEREFSPGSGQAPSPVLKHVEGFLRPLLAYGARVVVERF